MISTVGEKLLQFYRNLRPPVSLPDEIEILFPQRDTEVLKLVEAFLRKYYSDNKKRRLIFGINPGRFGAGITGINFTAPRQLRDNCGIEHSLGNSSELSAEFIYEMIGQFGGPDRFYGEYFLTSVSPLGFTRNGVNLNYYDNKVLQEQLQGFILQNIKKQYEMGFLNDRCICIGGEKNFRYLNALNMENRFTKEIISVPHPRFIMQYKRKQKQEYIDLYLQALQK